MRSLYVLFLALCAAGNCIGVFNVATHRGTTKGNWNLPVRETLQQLTALKSTCSQDLLVLTYDRTLTYQLEERGYETLGPYARFFEGAETLGRGRRCTVALLTFAGGSDDETVGRMFRELATIEYESKDTLWLGYDPDYRMKRRFDKSIPRYQVELVVFRGTTHLTGLASWSPRSDGCPEKLERCRPRK